LLKPQDSGSGVARGSQQYTPGAFDLKPSGFYRNTERYDTKLNYNGFRKE